MGLKGIGLFGVLAQISMDLLAPKSQWLPQREDKNAGVIFLSPEWSFFLFSEMLWFKFNLMWFYSFEKTPFSSTFGFASIFVGLHTYFTLLFYFVSSCCLMVFSWQIRRERQVWPWIRAPTVLGLISKLGFI